MSLRDLIFGGEGLSDISKLGSFSGVCRWLSSTTEKHPKSLNILKYSVWAVWRFWVHFFSSWFVFRVAFFSVSVGHASAVAIKHTQMWNTIGCLFLLLLHKESRYKPHSFFFLSLPSSQVSSGYLVVAFVYVTEFVGIKARTWASMHVHAFFAVGIMVVALVGYLVRTWWVYQIFLSIATLPFVLCCWMLPETPLWLLSEGRYEDAQKVINIMARWNKVSTPCKVSELCSVQQDDLVRTGDNDTSSTKKHNILDLFCNWHIARRTITVWLIWFTGSLGYYVFSLSSVSLGGNEYLNLFLIGKYFCTLFCLWQN